jgi:hypothetical protein
MAGDGITRRSFLAGTGGLVVATAVGANAGATTAARNKAISPLVLSTDLYASPTPQRFVFAIAVGSKYSSSAPAQVGFLPPGASGTATVTVQRTRLDRAGLPKGRGVYVADALFDQPGVWKGLVVTRGRKTPFAVEVKPAPEAPAIGAVAPRAPSPTKNAPLGVHPICTRVPVCPLHTVSLSDVIGAGKPVAVLFATPALCQSMYCGPVLDELLKITDAYAEKITFVHVEIYTSNRGADKAPTVEAWGIPSEPWLFTVDGAGTILGRIDGAFGGDEMKFQLDALAATA